MYECGPQSRTGVHELKVALNKRDFVSAHRNVTKCEAPVLRCTEEYDDPVHLDRDSIIVTADGGLRKRCRPSICHRRQDRRFIRLHG